MFIFTHKCSRVFAGIFSFAPVNILMVLLFFTAGCLQREKEQEELLTSEETYLSLTPNILQTQELRSINTGDEDFVSEIRLIVCKPLDGSVVLNKKLTFPSTGIGAGAGYSTQSAPEKIKSGVYNLYFVANESSVLDASTKLASVSSESNLKRITLDFDRNFRPSKAQKKGLLMMGEVLGTAIPPRRPAVSPHVVRADLRRTVAKVAFTFFRPSGSPAEQKNLYISGLKMYKLPTKYYIIPNETPGYLGVLEAWTDFVKPIPFSKRIDRYVPEYKGNERVKLDISIRQDETATERIKVVELAKDDGYKFTRNHHHEYKFTLNDWDDISVEIKVGDWTETTSWVYVGEFFNLWVSKKNYAPSEKIQLKLTTSKPLGELPPEHEVQLQPISGATVDDAASTVSFKENAYGASREYMLTTSPSGRPSLRVLYNGKTEVEL